MNDPDLHWKTLQPEQLSFTSYPYEWSFHQLQQAALLTLEINRTAIAHGMILKDATPFNIQFVGCRPVFIDTLSFDIYNERSPWIAYRQFCETFLAPLAIMHYAGGELNKILLAYPTGIPLRVAARLLPWRARWNMGLLAHIFFQSSVSGRRHANSNYTQRFSKHRMLAITGNLENTIKKLSPARGTSEWSGYYTEGAHSSGYIEEKELVVRKLLSGLPLGTVVDIGGNDGHFSKIAATFASRVITVDSDAASIDRFFLEQNSLEGSVHDVVVADIAFPSPSLGALLRERENLLTRLRCDTVLALGIVHHLVITKGFSFAMAAKLFALLGENLLIEFPLPGDEKVQLISSHITDLSERYTHALFSGAFRQYFDIVREEKLQSAERIVLLLKRKIN